MALTSSEASENVHQSAELQQRFKSFFYPQSRFIGLSANFCFQTFLSYFLRGKHERPIVLRGESAYIKSENAVVLYEATR